MGYYSATKQYTPDTPPNNIEFQIRLNKRNQTKKSKYCVIPHTHTHTQFCPREDGGDGVHAGVGERDYQGAKGNFGRL